MLSNEMSTGEAGAMHSPGCVEWGARCGGLNAPKRLIYLKASATDGGTVWEGLAGVALLEAVCKLRLCTGVSKVHSRPSLTQSQSPVADQT